MGIPARRGFGRAETLKEKMFRLRGVIALVSVPVRPLYPSKCIVRKFLKFDFYISCIIFFTCELRF